MSIALPSAPWRVMLDSAPADVSTDATLWEAARLGSVYDMDTGKHVIDIDAAMYADIEKAFAVQKECGVSVPFDLKHGMSRGGDQRSYGDVTSIISEGGLLKLGHAVNELGTELVKSGGMKLSPTLRGPFYHPSTGEFVSDTYMESCAITPHPMQDQISAVELGKGMPRRMLAKFDTSIEVEEFDSRLRLAALALTKKSGYPEAEWVNLREWRGDESGQLVVSFWADGDEQTFLLMDWVRDGDAVTVSSARPAKQVTEYVESKEPTSPITVTLAKTKGANMRKYDFTVLLSACIAADSGAGVELSKPDIFEAELPNALADALGAVVERINAQSVELAKANALAVSATADAANSVELSKQVGTLSAELKAIQDERAIDKLNAEADAWAAELGKAGRIFEGRVNAEGIVEDDTRPTWAGLYKQLGKDAAVKFADETRAAKSFKPVQLGRGAGVQGEPVAVKGADRLATVKAYATEHNISIAEAAQNAPEVTP